MKKANNPMSASDQNILNFPTQNRVNDVQAAAIDWAELIQSGRATQEERVRFDVWLAQDERHAQAYRTLEQWWRDVDYVASDDSELEAELESYALKERVRNVTARRRLIGAMAAAFFGAMLLWQFMEPGEVVPGSHYETAVGELRTVELEDGSRITLAGDSVITASFSDNARGVELISGQAYFEVTPDKTRIFTVRVGKSRVRVVGTKFDIQKGRNNIRVSVVEGLVEVAGDDGAVVSRHVKAGEQVFAALHDGSSGQVQSFEPEKDIAWKQGRLEYRNTPLVRVIEEVNRYRTHKIILRGKALEEYPITVSLDFRETDRLLKGLEEAGVAHISHRADTVVIDSKNIVE